MTENTLCFDYKHQIFRKITALHFGNYMKNFVKKRAKFLSVNAVLRVFTTVGSTQC